ncbi:DUF370 domain-containing protein [Crassaminicella thermophila]|uniref:DUF370 domain-containing protein n=1 Tax=Crassaminicella thermophila TaxID=2599308 RepID=A0A5C0SA83_CRATE|nr:extracellular matrix/biofilm biosynthesis regulator RemA family protein [Crassaminicella thermophila]QEK10887.1 DUF370 domain-containing protein [Crassaminicella thermophila]
MFLHLGKDVVVPIENIVAIIDSASIEKSKDSKEFFRIAEEEGFVEKISDEKIKSCIIAEFVEKNGKPTKKVVKTVIYYSPISSVTLQKRANLIDDMYSLEEVYIK